MNKTILRRLGAACGLATLFLGSPAVHAFCTEVDVGLSPSIAGARATSASPAT